MTTTAHIEEIETTRIGGFGGSDAAMFYRIGLKGLSALTKSDKKRIRVAKGLDEYKSIPVNEAMRRGHDFEDWYAENVAIVSLEREKKFSRKMARNFDTFFHADFSNEKYIYELKCVQDVNSVKDNYFHQLQWQYMIAPVGMKVYLEVFDSSKEFGLDNLRDEKLIERDELTIEILRMGIKRIDESWNELDLSIGEEWQVTDLMPFEQKDVELLSSALRQIKEMEAKADEFKAQVLAFMEANNILSLKSDTYSITYVPESITMTFDKKKLFSEHPKINETDYLRSSTKKRYLKITLN